MKHFKIALLAACLLHAPALLGQTTRKVLFLGNSYTYVNNLPQLIADAATSTGKTLVFDSNTPGGYYLGEHVHHPVSLAKIAAGGWDNIVLQDQSMALAYPSTYLGHLPYSVTLDSLTKVYSACAQTIFYATWGRKNGDTYLCTPPECATDTWISRTYYELDSAIERHYKVFADSVRAAMTPVGTVWRYIRRQYPAIELFQADESHPSLAGSYAAACAFYATIFRSDPSAITYNPGLSAADAAAIRDAARLVVYNRLGDWNVGRYDALLPAGCRSLGTERHRAEGVRVFPNPVTDELSVRLPAGVTGTVRICNAMGLPVKEVAAAQAARISLRDLPAGLYLVFTDGTLAPVRVLKK